MQLAASDVYAIDQVPLARGAHDAFTSFPGLQETLTERATHSSLFRFRLRPLPAAFPKQPLKLHLISHMSIDTQAHAG